MFSPLVARKSWRAWVIAGVLVAPYPGPNLAPSLKAAQQFTAKEPPRKGVVMTSHRPTICGTRHAVSAGHYLATMAGFAILEAGGNAIDAGCAAGIALGVLQPDLVNFAGVAPIILRLADGTVETIAGLGHWPRALDPDLFMRHHGGHIPEGDCHRDPRRTSTPGLPPWSGT